ncbi:unnamed protein product [Arctia plantaginis]|uniref:Uncharacterized protein n=1 Tax=Arctia plantaginis TaxID=874455 RepID=A0A8S1ARN0_ARCPL|nr:unnamed protein product [Arctia plantaginis]
MYLQQRNETFYKPHQGPNTVQSVPAHIPKPLYTTTPTAFWPMPTLQRPVPTTPQPFRFTPPPHQSFRGHPAQQQPQVRMPSHTQRMLSARPPNYNPQSNVFRLPPRNQPVQYNPQYPRPT